MKKPLAFILSLVIVITFVACGGTTTTSNSKPEYEFESLEWSDYDNAKQLPIPKSELADIRNENDVRYELYVAETTREAYNEYVQDCKDKGFVLDVTEQDSRYHAFNEREYELTLKYIDGDIMYIEVVEKRFDVEVKLLHMDSKSADMYDLRIEIDGYWEEDSNKGDEAIAFDSYLKKGAHTLVVENDNDDDISGRIDFTVTEDEQYFEFKVNCLSNEIEIFVQSEDALDNNESVPNKEQVGITEATNAATENKTAIVNGLFNYTANSFSERFEKAVNEYDGANLALCADLDNEKLIIDESYYLFYRIQDVDNNYYDIGMISFIEPDDITLPMIDEFTSNKFNTINILVEKIDDIPMILVCSMCGADPTLDFTIAYNVGMMVADKAGTAEGYTYNGINYVIATDGEYYYIIISTIELDKSDYTEPSNTPTKNIDHYCEAVGCNNEGTKSIKGLSGYTEYYCSTHYEEMMDIISMMESDVGKNSASKHTCEECSREGTHSIIGISGRKEYYCTTHYNEMKEFMEIFG